jgi:hypothetical protein
MELVALKERFKRAEAGMQARVDQFVKDKNEEAKIRMATFNALVSSLTWSAGGIVRVPKALLYNPPITLKVKEADDGSGDWIYTAEKHEGVEPPPPSPDLVAQTESMFGGPDARKPAPDLTPLAPEDQAAFCEKCWAELQNMKGGMMFVPERHSPLCKRGKP